MSTVVITGGTDGIGRALATHHLRQGDTVVVVGRSRPKFDALVAAVGGTPHFVAADLRLARESLRVVADLRSRFRVIDVLVLGAAYVHRDRSVTEEGFEHTFALYYLSRHVLAHGLAAELRAAPNPLVLDLTVPGAARDAIQWDDLQLTSGFSWRAANQQSRRAAELSALRLSGDIRCALWGPSGLVRTSLQGELGPVARPLTNALKATLGRPVEQAIAPLAALTAQPPAEPLTAHRGTRRIPLAIGEADHRDAARLHSETERLLAPFRTADPV
ncbi:SDR family NAD(P)-dependent oxidoreductase [Streptomyces hainanensis]|uniref:SDR family NAD(P)-dependent oxidoreductase n=1 Tax=Streptomyces hainanensis TaxID=402648 RepID=A0A4V2Y3B3_9ACTN|nr:SDR family NAD(P)-dependent oxidoreductase [Streptomyces hainanensis]TDC75825.1 SDR family NAD(P)-dependent oxidoreductase [Streptomyces hainanensis]